MVDPKVEHAISGCTNVVGFESTQALARAVGTLLACHPHHFVVIPDAGLGLSIACSPHAVRCLMEHLGPSTINYGGARIPIPPPEPPPEARFPW